MEFAARRVSSWFTASSATPEGSTIAFTKAPLSQGCFHPTTEHSRWLGGECWILTISVPYWDSRTLPTSTCALEPPQTWSRWSQSCNAVGASPALSFFLFTLTIVRFASSSETLPHDSCFLSSLSYTVISLNKSVSYLLLSWHPHSGGLSKHNPFYLFFISGPFNVLICLPK